MLWGGSFSFAPSVVGTQAVKEEEREQIDMLSQEPDCPCVDRSGDHYGHHSNLSPLLLKKNVNLKFCGVIAEPWFSGPPREDQTAV